MNATVVKHYVSIVGILALTLLGGIYVVIEPDPRPDVVIAVVAGIAGLGGYSIQKRAQLDS